MWFWLSACLYIPESALTDRAGREPPDVDVDADVDADSDADADTDTDTDTDSGHPDSDPDTGTGPVEPCGTGREDGAALHFTHPTDTVTILDDNRLDFSTTWTLEMWVWLDGTPGLLVEKFQQDVENKTFQIRSDGSVSAFVYAGGNDASLQGALLAPGAWHNIVFEADNAQMSIYQDGRRVSAQAWGKDAFDGFGDLHFGYVDHDDTPSFQGYLGGVRITDETKFDTDYLPEPYPQAEAHTRGLWMLGKGTGSLAEDSSGNSLTGVISGATWASAPCR